MSPTEKELNEIRKALLGTVDEISGFLKKAAEQLNTTLEQTNKLNRHLATIKAQATMTGITPQDKALLNKVAHTIENKITPYIATNDQNKKQAAIKGLKEIKDELQQSPSTPRPGSKGSM